MSVEMWSVVSIMWEGGGNRSWSDGVKYGGGWDVRESDVQC